MMILMPIFGLNQGSQPILGYNYGAKKYKRVLEAYIRTISAATAICTAGFIIAQLFSLELVKLFAPQGSEAILSFAPWSMRVITLFLPLNGFQIVSSNLFVVTGRPKISIFLAMLRQCIILVPCILLFGKVWGLWGVVAAGPAADAFSFLLTAVMIFFELRKLRRQIKAHS